MELEHQYYTTCSMKLGQEHYTTCSMELGHKYYTTCSMELGQEHYTTCSMELGHDQVVWGNKYNGKWGPGLEPLIQTAPSVRGFRDKVLQLLESYRVRCWTTPWTIHVLYWKATIRWQQLLSSSGGNFKVTAHISNSIPTENVSGRETQLYSKCSFVQCSTWLNRIH